MKINLPSTQVTPADLNGVDAMNGQASVASKGQVVAVAPQSLKGALNKYNNAFSQHDELTFIRNVMNGLFDLQTGLVKYENLPEELDISRIEKKPFMNGSALWYKVNGQIVVTNYALEDFNIYEEPTIVSIIEPKSPLLNKVKVDTRTNNAHIFRNNWSRISTYQKAFRWIRDMERTLFQLEKNITSSAPKGLINLKNKEIAFSEPSEDPVKSSMETIANSQDTFFVLKSVGDDKYNAMNENDEQIYIPMELTDRTDTLIRNYTFFKEQLKETLGGEINIHQKKERVGSTEVENQQGLATKVKQAYYEVRKRDIEQINKKFGLNIIVSLNEPEEQEDEQYEDEEGKGE